MLATVLKMYKAMDTAWLIECYLALRQRSVNSYCDVAGIYVHVFTISK